MSSKERQYGPNWAMIQRYIEEIPEGFLFQNVGQPDPADRDVRRIHDWDTLEKSVDYSFEGADAKTCPYLRFLLLCDRVRQKAEALGTEHALHEALVNATAGAADTYASEVGGEQDEQFLEFVYSVEPEYYWRASIQDHCSYIATEMVVAHLTDIHLMRDMWYWYRAGHWPCGWEGDWPEGRLIVF